MARWPDLPMVRFFPVLSYSAHVTHHGPLRDRYFSRQLSPVSGGTYGRQAAGSAAGRVGGGVDDLPGLLSSGLASRLPLRALAGDAAAAAGPIADLHGFARCLPGSSRL